MARRKTKHYVINSQYICDWLSYHRFMQKDLANMTGYSESFISMMLSQDVFRATMELTFALADAMFVDPRALVIELDGVGANE